MSEEQSRRQLVKTGALNPMLRRLMRALKLVMENHIDQGGDIDDEAEIVAKHTLLLMLTRYFKEEDIFILADTPSLRKPTRLNDTSTFEINRILDGKPIDDFVNEDDSDDSGIGAIYG